MHDAIIFSLRWHQIIEELPVCIWGKSEWVNIGISDSKIETREKNERNFGGETHNYYFRFLPTQIGHIQFLHLEDKREKP